MYLNALALKAQTIDHDAYTASSGGRVCCYETQKGGKRRKRKERREKQEEVENNLSERNEEEEPAIGGGRRKKGKDGGRDGAGGGRAITAMSSVTDLHRPLHSHSPRLLSMELLSSVAYHLKILLRFHKNQIAVR